jgi:hypothetical protein
MYALAASAAGVGALALAQPAEARIVYTKAHQRIGVNGTYSLDLNHDGVVDFLIQEWPGGSVQLNFNEVLAKEALGNAVQGSGVTASALNAGGQIGPSQRFVSGGLYGEGMAFFSRTSYSGKTFVGGPWANVTNRYLGLKFRIHGKIHYGWARLSVSIPKKGCLIVATLTGYAYETIAGKPIRAGQTGSAPDQSTASLNPAKVSLPNPSADSIPAVLKPARLGMLALGAQAIPFWRRTQ